MYEAGEDFLRALLVPVKLRAAMRMAVRENAVDVVGLKGLALALDRARDGVHAADSRDDPGLVADADAAVLAQIAVKRIGFIELHLRVMCLCRLILVVQQVTELALDVVRVHPRARLDIFLGRADGEAVFHDILAFFDGLDGHFMPGRDIAERRIGLPAQSDGLALLDGAHGHGDVIFGMDAEKFQFCHTYACFPSSSMCAFAPISWMRAKCSATFASKPAIFVRSSPHQSAWLMMLWT